MNYILKSPIRITISLAIVIIIVIILLHFHISKTAPNIDKYVTEHNEKLKWQNYDCFLKEANNGDLVFMSGDSRGEKVCKWMTNSLFSHVGILFREYNENTEEDILYIFDSDLGNKIREGPRICRFTDKVNRYHGSSYIGWRKLTGKRPSTSDILKIVEKYCKNYTFDNTMLKWFTSDGFLSFMDPVVKNNNEVFCSELVALFYQNSLIRVLKSPEEGGKKAHYYTPNKFVKTIKDLNAGFDFEEIRIVLTKKKQIP